MRPGGSCSTGLCDNISVSCNQAETPLSLQEKTVWGEKENKNPCTALHDISRLCLSPYTGTLLNAVLILKRWLCDWFSLSVCFFVSRITQTVLSGLALNQNSRYVTSYTFFGGLQIQIWIQGFFTICEIQHKFVFWVISKSQHFKNM